MVKSVTLTNSTALPKFKMVLNKNPPLRHIRSISIASRKYARIEYEIPERYRNSFYLANAAFFDSSNWFLHRAYEVVFPALKKMYRANFQDRNVGDKKIHEKLENIVESLDQCNSILDVRFPVLRESGKLEIIRGFRAHYGETVRRTPCLGGLRINENITRDHMKALSLLSAMKNSCLGIGLSGAHGGLKINSKQYSEDELRNIVDIYVKELYKKGYCGYRDVIHPDINTSRKEMKWVQDSFAKCSGYSCAAAVGKPAEDGGIPDYEKAAAMGALKALEMILHNSNLMVNIGIVSKGLKDKKFILQGLGKVGRPLGLMLVEKGAICVGVKEQEAYLYDANGIDLDKLIKHRAEAGSIEKFALTKTDNPDSIYTEDCDILVLAACQKSLACYVARDVKAKIIVEASDGPVTPSAHKILTSKAKLVVPDIYACAGANVASYFEYLRNLQQMDMSEEHILRFSDGIYSTIFKSTMQDKQRAVLGGIETQKSIVTDVSTLNSDFTKNAIDCVFSEVGEEILKNLETYKLETDVRTAAYAAAIKNMFKTIYEQQQII